MHQRRKRRAPRAGRSLWIRPEMADLFLGVLSWAYGVYQAAIRDKDAAHERMEHLASASGRELWFGSEMSRMAREARLTRHGNKNQDKNKHTGATHNDDVNIDQNTT
jgi:hypothetical protein